MYSCTVSGKLEKFKMKQKSSEPQCERSHILQILNLCDFIYLSHSLINVYRSGVQLRAVGHMVRIQFPVEAEVLLFVSAPRLVLMLTHCLINACWHIFPWAGAESLEHETHHTPVAKVSDTWNLSFTTPYIFMAQRTLLFTLNVYSLKVL